MRLPWWSSGQDSVPNAGSPGLMHDTGSLGLVHGDDPEGWYGEGGERGVQDGDHMFTHSHGFK